MEAVEQAQLLKNEPSGGLLSLDEFVREEEQADTPPQGLKEKLATEVIQAQLAGLDEEAIKERIKERYNLDDETAEITVKTILEMLRKKQEQEFELQKTALGIVPALAKSNNPLTPLLLQSIIEKAGLNKSEDDDIAKQIIKLKMELAKAKMISEALKDDTPRSDSSFQALILEMIRQMEKEKAEAQKLLYQLLLEKKEKSDDGLKEVLVELIDAIDQRLQMMMEIISKQGNTTVVEKAKDPLEEMAEFSQKIETLLKAMEQLGYKVEKPGNDPLKQFELQAKLKELELKQKEVEAKQVFYAKLAETLSNPQTLQIIFEGLKGIFAGLLGRAPSPQTFSNALASAPVPASPAPTQAPLPEPKPPEDIPSLEEFVQQAGGEANG